jgi:NAD(P)-dependent dehydrogenase (short-subunit alcohol dehydrogenase family)
MMGKVDQTKPLILVTGATGYVGGRLIPRLLGAGYRVRAMGRSIEKMAHRPWACHPRVELVRGDVQDKGSLIEAARGCRAAMILGSGSASFEILRYLAERLPLMITPQVGPQSHPAHRHRQCARLPGAMPGQRRRLRPHL